MWGSGMPGHWMQPCLDPCSEPARLLLQRGAARLADGVTRSQLHLWPTTVNPPVLLFLLVHLDLVGFFSDTHPLVTPCSCFQRYQGLVSSRSLQHSLSLSHARLALPRPTQEPSVPTWWGSRSSCQPLAPDLSRHNRAQQGFDGTRGILPLGI